MWTAQFYPFKNYGQWVTSGGLGTMGFGIPSAIGAQLAEPRENSCMFCRRWRFSNDEPRNGFTSRIWT